MTDLDDWYGGPSGFVAAREEMHNHDCGDGLAYPHPTSAHHFSGTTTLPDPESAPQPVISPQQPASWAPPAPRTELIWAAVDLDGCIAEGVWTPSSSGREIGPPIERNIRKLRTLRESGYKIVIHTARGWEHYEAIESWLTFWNIPFDRIVCGKLLAAVYVDDRAVESEQLSWSPDAQGQRQTWARVHATAAHEEF